MTSESTYQVVAHAELLPHPENRKVEMKGEKWTSLVASVREHGLLQPLLVRPHPEVVGRMEIIAGERRWRAAGAAGLKELACMVRDLTNREALEIILIENLEREDLDPVEEARGVRALIQQAGMSPGEVAARLSRSLEWVTTRQGLLDLPDEVITAVKRPATDDRHLHVGTVQLILGLPVEDRAQAVQLVLHPQFQATPLRPQQAAEMIKQAIVVPRKARQLWEESRPKLVKAWTARLKKHLPKAMQADLVVRAVTWEEAHSQSSGRDVEEVLPLSEVTVAAPVPLMWLHLAVRHGLSVSLVPDDGPEQSRAVVDARMLRAAEAACGEPQKRKVGEEAGEAVWEEVATREAWLLSRAKGTSNVEHRTSNIEGKKAEQLRRAHAAVDGEPEHPEMTDDGAPKVEVVESVAVVMPWSIDGGPVRGLRMWAEREMKNQAAQEGEIRTPDFPLPDWARGIDLEDVIAVCDWVEGLKR